MIKTILFSALAIGFILFPMSVFSQQNDSSSEKGAGILGAINVNLIPECIRDEGSRTADGSCVTDAILFYTNILLVMVAIGSFVYMLYGAFQYATAYGDDAKIVLAKKTITYAIIGVIIAGISVLLVALVRSALGA